MPYATAVSNPGRNLPYRTIEPSLSERWSDIALAFGQGSVLQRL
ncbi:hypothetical protein GCM10011503_32750 [Henriciella pelagia]|uniref:Uncharacterized protein n=1 Tax=Henriciella pelagia TaxID=1977912 RepID=A0ABQ1K1H2_9PROT|nr:hypothetical protein GCM10011503_32750 [Henriciella pelagia]